ncbi:hypothetical protein [Streptomyces sp. NPDC002785]|uniref:hypothetical protein n=1 Tax=Streptomyces sp. NPDC002785 TaxID=3154543 RepID=UPI00331CD5A0
MAKDTDPGARAAERAGLGEHFSAHRLFRPTPLPYLLLAVCAAMLIAWVPALITGGVAGSLIVFGVLAADIVVYCWLQPSKGITRVVLYEHGLLLTSPQWRDPRVLHRDQIALIQTAETRSDVTFGTAGPATTITPGYVAIWLHDKPRPIVIRKAWAPGTLRLGLEYLADDYDSE